MDAAQPARIRLHRHEVKLDVWRVPLGHEDPAVLGDSRSVTLARTLEGEG